MEMFRFLTGAVVYSQQKYGVLSLKHIRSHCLNFSTHKTLNIRNAKQKSPVPSNNCYVQGKTVDRTRQYFYYVDSHGRLYLNDTRLKNFLTSFKDKDFLTRMFSGIQLNDGDYMQDFPFYTRCRKWEINYIGCECVPMVFTHCTKMTEPETGITTFSLIYNHADPTKALVTFEPKNLFMSDSGRLYHPAPAQAGGIGLISTELSLFFSSMLEFKDGQDKAPTHIWFMNEKIQLNREWYKNEHISRFIQ